MAKLPKRTALDNYLLTKEIPYFRSEPFKLVATPIWLESEKEYYIDPYVNANKFVDYHSYLISYKKNYDLIFTGLTNPVEKAEFKQKICSKLRETTQYPNYQYLEYVTDLLEQIESEYLLYKQGLKTVDSESVQRLNLSDKGKALKMFYEGKTGVTRGIEGDSLYNKYTNWSKRINRIANDGTDLQLRNKIELFEKVISVLDDKFKQQAIDELEILKSYQLKN